MDKDLNIERREIEKDLWELEKRQSMRRKVETILKMYSLMGLVIAIIGMTYFVFITLDINLSETQIIALLMSGTGIALSVASWALLVIRRERVRGDVKKLQSMQELSEFIWKWSKFEAIGKEILTAKGIEFNRLSIREIIEHLYGDNLIDKVDALSLEEAIQARNMAVHGGGVIPREMLARYSSQVDEIISKLEQRKINV